MHCHMSTGHIVPLCHFCTIFLINCCIPTCISMQYSCKLNHHSDLLLLLQRSCLLLIPLWLHSCRNRGKTHSSTRTHTHTIFLVNVLLYLMVCFICLQHRSLLKEAEDLALTLNNNEVGHISSKSYKTSVPMFFTAGRPQHLTLQCTRIIHRKTRLRSSQVMRCPFLSLS